MKGTINKTISKEKGFLNFLSPLMIVGIQVMIIASLAINVLIPLGLTEEASESDTAIHNLWITNAWTIPLGLTVEASETDTAIQNLWITHDCTDNLK